MRHALVGFQMSLSGVTRNSIRSAMKRTIDLITLGYDVGGNRQTEVCYFGKPKAIYLTMLILGSISNVNAAFARITEEKNVRSEIPSLILFFRLTLRPLRSLR